MKALLFSLLLCSATRAAAQETMSTNCPYHDVPWIPASQCGEPITAGMPQGQVLGIMPGDALDMQLQWSTGVIYYASIRVDKWQAYDTITCPNWSPTIILEECQP